MLTLILVLFVFVAIVLLFATPIFLIAYYFARKRQQQQDEMLKKVPSGAEFPVAMRYNKGGEQQKTWIKVSAWQGFGVMYVLDGKIHFCDTQRLDPYVFDLASASIQWVGINLANGLVPWFKIQDQQADYYFNPESGALLWPVFSGKPTSRKAFETLKAIQADYLKTRRDAGVMPPPLP